MAKRIRKRQRTNNTGRKIAGAITRLAEVGESLAPRLDADGDPSIERVVSREDAVLFFERPEHEGDEKRRAQVRALLAIAEIGTVSAGVRASGVTRKTFNKWLEEDEFKEAFDYAMADVVDDMEEIAILRAKAGSDALMMMLLKAYRPEKFTETRKLVQTGADGGPIQHEHRLAGARDLLRTKLKALASVRQPDGSTAEVMEGSPS